jgi:hypothetical protein
MRIIYLMIAAPVAAAAGILGGAAFVVVYVCFGLIDILIDIARKLAGGSAKC